VEHLAGVAPDRRRRAVVGVVCRIGGAHHFCGHPRKRLIRAVEGVGRGELPTELVGCLARRSANAQLACSVGEDVVRREDQGARVVVNADPSRVLYVEVDDPGVVLDLDTPADLASAGLAPPPSPT